MQERTEYAPVQSMTGHGKAHSFHTSFAIDVEIRSVNSRHRDIHIRSPFEDFALEFEIRECIQQHFTRGRVDVLIRRVEAQSKNSEVQYLKKQDIIAFLKEVEGLQAEVSDQGFSKQLLPWLPVILQKKDFLESRSESEAAMSEDEKNVVREGVQAAVRSCLEARESEGAALRVVLEGHLCELLRIVADMHSCRREQREEIERLWKKRQDEFSQGAIVSEERIHQELFFFLERSDITEELNRLIAHGEACRAAILKERPLGRRLDFLCQEIGRELNTAGSKAQHSHLQHLVVEAKLQLEQLREQVQNIE